MEAYSVPVNLAEPELRESVEVSVDEEDLWKTLGS